MNPTRASKRDDLEANANYRVHLAHLLPETLANERLSQLQTFIRQLKGTPAGQSDLRRRVKRLGNCRRISGETASRFYGRLRNWLDEDVDRQAKH